MATINAKLTITSSDATTDTLSLTVSKGLTVGPPAIGISKVAINVAGGTDTALVPSSAGNKYVYVKHTTFQADGTTASNNEIVVDIGAADVIRINSGEWAFFPAKASTAITAVSNHTSTILVEYAYWTAA
tara:strand:+ start:27 stop:416 length:390 start_codon:yes stop_codon:yes gene_type:complete